VASEPAERISISTERTFPRDLADRLELEERGRDMAAQIAEALRQRGRSARTVTVKLRYADFSTVTRGVTAAGATDDAAVIWDTARALLGRALDERPGALRLLGVGVSGLGGEGQLRLF
jgi:DNA polymerase-4